MESQIREERRKRPRKSCRLAVDGLASNSAFKGFAKNIGLGGVYIETPHAFAVTEEVILSFFGGEPIRVAGKVAWTASGGVGVAFKNTPQRLASAIKLMVPHMT